MWVLVNKPEVIRGNGQVAVGELQAKRDEEVEKEQWARILSKVNEDVDSDLDEEPGPWELTPDMLEEVDEVL